MKENKLEKLLWSIAKAASESTSIYLLYEPKVPEVFVKKDKKKER